MSSKIGSTDAVSRYFDVERKLEPFTLFPKLPTEMRHKIWHHACCFGRNIDLWVQHIPYGLVPSARGGDATHKNDHHPYQFVSHSRPPAVLHATKESRTIGLENFTLAFGTSWQYISGPTTTSVTSSPRIYVNWASDLICFMNQSFYRDCLVSNLFNTIELQKVKFLALRYLRPVYLANRCASKLSPLQDIVIHKSAPSIFLPYFADFSPPLIMTGFDKIDDKRGVVGGFVPSLQLATKGAWLTKLCSQHGTDPSFTMALMEESNLDTDSKSNSESDAASSKACEEVIDGESDDNPEFDERDHDENNESIGEDSEVVNNEDSDEDGIPDGVEDEYDDFEEV